MEPCDPSSSVGAAAERVETAELVRRALELVAVRDRQVLAWRHDEGRTFEAIGARLGLTLQGARKAHRVAADRFRAAYERLAGPVLIDG
jgi:DNA-directed RNA polymerase specialized sigma24 family protein